MRTETGRLWFWTCFLFFVLGTMTFWPVIRALIVMVLR